MDRGEGVVRHRCPGNAQNVPMDQVQLHAPHESDHALSLLPEKLDQMCDLAHPNCPFKKINPALMI